MWANELSTKHDSRTGKRDRLIDRNGSREVSFANTYPVGKASKQKIMSICGHENRILQSEETDLRMDVPPPLPLVPTQNIAK